MKSIANHAGRLVVRKDSSQWEQVVFAEVIVPEMANVYGDYWTEDAIKDAAYMYARKGFKIDLEHDNVDISDKVTVVEFFIVRDNDPDFIKGSWVVGMHIEDDAIWQAVLSGEVNGYSYEAMVEPMPATLVTTDDGVRQGTTEPDTTDGHTHDFIVLVGSDNRPIDGGTTENNGHSHQISVSTVTDEAQGHVHRYNLVTGKDGK